jgi:hypothetical protein
VLGSGRSNKTDANDGYSIVVAALHAPVWVEYSFAAVEFRPRPVW